MSRRGYARPYRDALPVSARLGGWRGRRRVGGPRRGRLRLLSLAAPFEEALLLLRLARLAGGGGEVRVLGVGLLVTAGGVGHEDEGDNARTGPQDEQVRRGGVAGEG